MKKNTWLIFYIIILVIHLVAIQFNYETLPFITKPLLMPLLAIYFITNTKLFKTNLKTWILLALFFSWVGDILLMFEEKAKIFFLLGLSAFLLAQVCYIIFFHGVRIRESVKGNVYFLLIVVVYYGILISILSPHLGDFKLPVRIYGVVISFMLMVAMHTVLGKNKKLTWWMLAGAILFVTSDSLLAFNKFLSPFAYAGILIMLTYGLAQLFIAHGAVKYIDQNAE